MRAPCPFLLLLAPQTHTCVPECGDPHSSHPRAMRHPVLVAATLPGLQEGSECWGDVSGGSQRGTQGSRWTETLWHVQRDCGQQRHRPPMVAPWAVSWGAGAPLSVPPVCAASAELKAECDRKPGSSRGIAEVSETTSHKPRREVGLTLSIGNTWELLTGNQKRTSQHLWGTWGPRPPGSPRGALGEDWLRDTCSAPRALSPPVPSTRTAICWASCQGAAGTSGCTQA